MNQKDDFRVAGPIFLVSIGRQCTERRRSQSAPRTFGGAAFSLDKVHGCLCRVSPGLSEKASM